MEVNGAVVRMSDGSRVAEARRKALDLGTRAGLDEVQCGRLALAVTELATNLVKHARDGEIVLADLGSGPGRGVRAIGIDRGPGVADLARALDDGYSTAGSPGTGLGAMKRSVDRFEMSSTPGVGTIVMLEVRPRPAETGGYEIGAVSVPRRGEDVCGDGWASRSDGMLQVMVVDGLGHGALAHDVAVSATQTFATRSGTPQRTIEELHGVLRAGRGAAVAIAEIDREAGSLRYCGVGNIVGAIVRGDHMRHLVSHGGTVGHVLTRTHPFDYPWSDDALLVLHSDGVAPRWRLDPALRAQPAAMIAAAIYRDHARGNDDATVVVVRRAS
jgi:anti-sigma regulatory factor (Ser/Thr protein kinase)